MVLAVDQVGRVGAGKNRRAGSEKAQAIGTKASRGTRASANTSGPDFTAGLGPMKLRMVKDTRTERRKPVSSAGPALKDDLPKSDPTVDLMSRRHPLSSTEPSDFHPGLV
jgi:hypothetical protein